MQYPSICWYQVGTYEIDILKETEGKVLSMGPFTYRGSDNPRITHTLQNGLAVNQLYRAVITATSYGENVTTEINFSTSRLFECTQLFLNVLFFTAQILFFRQSQHHHQQQTQVVSVIFIH